uniref:Uncharacterized protein n=1 Tax=Arion vulgaris TaxID=1028688 RepID=A0A0B7BMV3_9EUPU
MTLTFDNKSSGTGLLRLVITKNNVSPENETVVKIGQLMLTKDPFYKPQTSDTSLS